MSDRGGTVTGQDEPAAGGSGSGADEDERLDLRRLLERLMRRREAVLDARLRSPHHPGDVGDLAVPGESVESVEHRADEQVLADIARQIAEIEHRLAAIGGSGPRSRAEPAG